MCLAGVKQVTIYDPEQVTVADLGTQFFLRETDIGQRRDEATLTRLREVNRYVQVNIFEHSELLPDYLVRFQVVVLANALVGNQLEINRLTRERGIPFVSTDTKGLFG